MTDKTQEKGQILAAFEFLLSGTNPEIVDEGG